MGQDVHGRAGRSKGQRSGGVSHEQPMVRLVPQQLRRGMQQRRGAPCTAVRST